MVLAYQEAATPSPGFDQAQCRKSIAMIAFVIALLGLDPRADRAIR
jgi:hypothetical protein